MPSSPDLPGLLGEGSWPSSPLQPSSELPGTQGVLVAKTALEDGQRALCCTPSSPPGLVRGLRSLRGSSAQPELVGQVPAPRSGVFAPPSGSDLQPPPPPRPTLATRPWAAVTLSMSPTSWCGLGVRPECRPGLPRVRHDSPPSLHPHTWKAPQRRCPQTQGGGRCLHTDHPPAAGPPHGSTHTPRACARPAPSTGWRGAAETLRPTSCIRLESPGAEAVFLARPGRGWGPDGGGRWCAAADPVRSLGDRETVRALPWEVSLYLQRSLTQGGMPSQVGHEAAWGSHTPRPQTCPFARQGRCRPHPGEGWCPHRLPGHGEITATPPEAAPRAGPGQLLASLRPCPTGGPAPPSHTWTPVT